MVSTANGIEIHMRTPVTVSTMETGSQATATRSSAARIRRCANDGRAGAWPRGTRGTPGAGLAPRLVWRADSGMRSTSAALGACRCSGGRPRPPDGSEAVDDPLPAAGDERRVAAHAARGDGPLDVDGGAADAGGLDGIRVGARAC